MKNQPKTIADLKIIWTFEPNFRKISDTQDLIKKLNPKYSNLVISANNYKFHILDKICQLFIDEKYDFPEFLEVLDFEVRFITQFSKIMTLDHFESISQTEYRIHVKK